MDDQIKKKLKEGLAQVNAAVDQQVEGKPAPAPKPAAAPVEAQPQPTVAPNAPAETPAAVAPSAPVAGAPTGKGQVVYVKNLSEVPQGEIAVWGANLNNYQTGTATPGAGQAEAAAGREGWIGIPTKRSPSVFLKDADLNDPQLSQVIDSQLQRIGEVLSSGKNVYFPADGIGTGRAKLKESAPAVFSNLNEKLGGLGINNGPQRATGPEMEPGQAQTPVPEETMPSVAETGLPEAATATDQTPQKQTTASTPEDLAYEQMLRQRGQQQAQTQATAKNNAARKSATRDFQNAFQASYDRMYELYRQTMGAGSPELKDIRAVDNLNDKLFADRGRRAVRSRFLHLMLGSEPQSGLSAQMLKAREQFDNIMVEMGIAQSDLDAVRRGTPVSRGGIRPTYGSMEPQNAVHEAQAVRDIDEFFKRLAQRGRTQVLNHPDVAEGLGFLLRTSTELDRDLTDGSLLKDNPAQVEATIIDNKNSSPENMDPEIAKLVKSQTGIDPVYGEDGKVRPSSFSIEINGRTITSGQLTGYTTRSVRRYALDAAGLIDKRWAEVDELGLDLPAAANDFSPTGDSNAAIAMHITTDSTADKHRAAGPGAKPRDLGIETKVTAAMREHLGRKIGETINAASRQRKEQPLAIEAPIGANYEAGDIVLNRTMPYTRSTDSVYASVQRVRATLPPGQMVLLHIANAVGPIRPTGLEIYPDADGQVFKILDIGDPAIADLTKKYGATASLPFSWGEEVKYPSSLAGDRYDGFAIDVDPVVHPAVKHTLPLRLPYGGKFEGLYVPQPFLNDVTPGVETRDLRSFGSDAQDSAAQIPGDTVRVHIMADENGTFPDVGQIIDSRTSGGFRIGDMDGMNPQAYTEEQRIERGSLTQTEANTGRALGAAQSQQIETGIAAQDAQSFSPADQELINAAEAGATTQVEKPAGFALQNVTDMESPFVPVPERVLRETPVYDATQGYEDGTDHYNTLLKRIDKQVQARIDASATDPFVGVGDKFAQAVAPTPDELADIAGVRRKLLYLMTRRSTQAFWFRKNYFSGKPTNVDSVTANAPALMEVLKDMDHSGLAEAELQATAARAYDVAPAADLLVPMVKVDEYGPGIRISSAGRLGATATTLDSSYLARPNSPEAAAATKVYEIIARKDASGRKAGASYGRDKSLESMLSAQDSADTAAANAEAEGARAPITTEDVGAIIGEAPSPVRPAKSEAVGPEADIVSAQRGILSGPLDSPTARNEAILSQAQVALENAKMRLASASTTEEKFNASANIDRIQKQVADAKRALSVISGEAAKNFKAAPSDYPLAARPTTATKVQLNDALVDTDYRAIAKILKPLSATQRKSAVEQAYKLYSTHMAQDIDGDGLVKTVNSLLHQDDLKQVLGNVISETKYLDVTKLMVDADTGEILKPEIFGKQKYRTLNQAEISRLFGNSPYVQSSAIIQMARENGLDFVVGAGKTGNPTVFVTKAKVNKNGAVIDIADDIKLGAEYSYQPGSGDTASSKVENIEGILKTYGADSVIDLKPGIPPEMADIIPVDSVTGKQYYAGIKPESFGLFFGDDNFRAKEWWDRVNKFESGSGSRTKRAISSVKIMLDAMARRSFVYRIHTAMNEAGVQSPFTDADMDLRALFDRGYAIASGNPPTVDGASAVAGPFDARKKMNSGEIRVGGSIVRSTMIPSETPDIPPTLLTAQSQLEAQRQGVPGADPMLESMLKTGQVGDVMAPPGEKAPLVLPEGYKGPRSTPYQRAMARKTVSLLRQHKMATVLGGGVGGAVLGLAMDRALNPQMNDEQMKTSAALQALGAIDPRVAALSSLAYTGMNQGDMLRTIFNVAASFAGGAAGATLGAVAGPLGSVGGGMAGSMAASAAADSLYGAIAGSQPGDNIKNVPVNVAVREKQPVEQGTTMDILKSFG